MACRVNRMDWLCLIATLAVTAFALGLDEVSDSPFSSYWLGVGVPGAWAGKLWERSCFGLPFWVILVAFVAFPPATRAAGLLCASLPHRPAAGRCRSCGYDLRATPERCLDCGVVPRTE